MHLVWLYRTSETALKHYLEWKLIYSGKEKRRRLENRRVPDAKEVCDRIISEARSRFQSSSHLDVAKLLDCDNFLEYSQVFPENLLQMTVEQYHMLNKDKLRTELKVLYARQDFRNMVELCPYFSYL